MTYMFMPNITYHQYQGQDFRYIYNQLFLAHSNGIYFLTVVSLAEDHKV